MDTTVEYKDMLNLKKEIDNRLLKTDVSSIKELISYLDGNIIYENIKYSDTQLVMLQKFLVIWLKEITELDILGFEADIFEKVHSLKDLEEKYMIITFVILRFENEVSYADCMEGIEALKQYKISAVAIEELIYTESEKKCNNVISISNAFLEINQKITSYYLLKFGRQRYPNDINIINELGILEKELFQETGND